MGEPNSVEFPGSFDRVFQFFIYEFLVVLLKDMYRKRKNGFTKKQTESLGDYFSHVHACSAAVGDRWWFVFPFLGGTIEHKTQAVWNCFSGWCAIDGKDNETEQEREAARIFLARRVSKLSSVYRKNSKVLNSDLDAKFMERDIDFLYNLRSAGLKGVSGLVQDLIDGALKR